MARALRAVLILGLALPALAACNTVAGAGRDVKAAGQAVEETAERTRRRLAE